MFRRARPVPVFLVSSAADGFLTRLMGTTWTVFLVLQLDLSAFELVMLGTILETTYLLFEVPTGVVADTRSRRLSIVIGTLGTGVAFALVGLSTTFVMVAASQVLWGIFATFVSGADVAWVTDEVGEEAARSLYLRADQWAHAGALLGIVASVGLATIDLRLPFLAAGVGFGALGIVLALVMPEKPIEERQIETEDRRERSYRRTLREGIRQVRTHHVLFMILGVAALHGASTEGFDRLGDLHILTGIGLPPFGDLNRIWWFAVIDGVGLLVGLGAITLVRHHAHLSGHGVVAKLLAWTDLVLIGGVVAFGLTTNFWLALVAMWLVGALRSVREPIFTAWINQGLDPATRATVNSMGSLSDAVGQSAGGPVLGAIAGLVSVPAALVASGLLRAPALLLYRRAIRRGTVGTVAPGEMDPVLSLDPEEPLHAAEEDRLLPEGPNAER
jgi:DHA3 family tetracycline resistance protein-like MFS transporter